MKYIIDTDLGTCVPYLETTLNKTIDSEMMKFIGAKEWDEVVTKIQTWFYGSLVKAPWCATGVSFFASLAGKTVVGRYENVDSMKDHMNAQGLLDCTEKYGGGAYKPKIGDLVFMSYNCTYADCTHVGVVHSVNNDTGETEVLSCNCDHEIKLKTYNYKTGKYIVAFGRVD